MFGESRGRGGGEPAFALCMFLNIRNKISQKGMTMSPLKKTCEEPVGSGRFSAVMHSREEPGLSVAHVFVCEKI